MARASLSWAWAANTSQVQRSTCSGWRTLGVVQPRVCFMKRIVCSRSNLRQYAFQRRSRSSPLHQSHSFFGLRVSLGSLPTSTRTAQAPTFDSSRLRQSQKIGSGYDLIWVRRCAPQRLLERLGKLNEAAVEVENHGAVQVARACEEIVKRLQEQENRLRESEE